MGTLYGYVDATWMEHDNLPLYKYLNIWHRNYSNMNIALF